jgi:hypothetical protein
MRTRSLLVTGLLAATTAAAVTVPACTKDRQEVPAPRAGGAGSGRSPASTAAGGGDGDGDGGRDGSGGAGGQSGEGGDGAGGGPVSLPACACLLDTVRTEACGTCVQFGVVDECAVAYADCQSNADCVAVDNCILDQRCESSACLAACRDLGTPEARDLLDAMYACACNVCIEDCDDGDTCR